MCGIAGVLGLDDRALAKRMCDAIRHRGPDEEGYYSDGNVSLGSRRLSIIDLFTGRQPIHNEDGNVQVVYNGEIYNFPDLKKTLEKGGHRFYTSTDTEVIVHAYEEFGEGFVKKLNGMFAIALWDSQKKTLFLYRDHVGIKPLYYFYDRSQGVLLFASEIKALLEYERTPRQVNPFALNNYLSYKHTLFNETMFRSIYKLEPGHFMRVEKGSIEIKKWWDLSFSDGGTLQEFSRALEDSVRAQLISDVPLGLFLSGGIDSGAIAAVMKSLGQEIKSFTVAFPGGEADEARETAEFLGTDHREVFLEEDSYRLLPEIINHMDEPTGDVSSLALYRLSEEARKHVKVVLNGAGGDEMLAGYLSHRIGTVNQKLWFIPRPIRKAVYAIKLLPGWERQKEAIISSVTSRTPLEAFLAFKEIIKEDEKRELLKVTGFAETKKIIADRFSQMPGGLNQLLYVDAKTSLVDDILLVTDKMTMAHGLEARVPLLDLQVIDAASKLPEGLKLKGLVEKFALREAMKGKLPSPARKKRPFRMPVEGFFQKHIQEIASSLLSESEVEKKGYFSYPAVRRIIEAHKKGSRHAGYKLFSILAFDLWHREFIEGEKGKL